MQNPAPTEVPIHEIVNIAGARALSATRTSRPKSCKSLFEAARWAPSSSNMQPWAYIVGTREDKGQLREGSQHAGRIQPGMGEKCSGASALRRAKQESEGRIAESSGPFTMWGAPAPNLRSKPIRRGLLVHQMAGLDANKAREVFAIPARLGGRSPH